jgi:hypothetical protein
VDIGYRAGVFCSANELILHMYQERQIPELTMVPCGKFMSDPLLRYRGVRCGDTRRRDLRHSSSLRRSVTCRMLNKRGKTLIFVSVREQASKQASKQSRETTAPIHPSLTVSHDRLHHLFLLGQTINITSYGPFCHIRVTRTQEKNHS